ncbi:MAG: glycoside hydrolase family 3 C-terminal domain-containing protein [Oscillospiraceae bacterium]|jgi:beta-glucosidase|nr:glycoside hydrolase family 3 C-terminal domain-containing protein [Oscillospiraceae bacterium]
MKYIDIISKMTLEEKASLCSGLNFWETKPIDRLGVPSIMMNDGPHGLRKVGTGPEDAARTSVPATCFPPAVLTACSFDRDLLREMGEAIGLEADIEDVRIVLGPGVNIKRSPLCGRNFEYFSEDPYLAGEMAANFIEGVQSKGIGTSLKHYAANNQETRRWSSDSIIDERTLREIYLPAFKKAVESAKPTTVMCAYNRVNGEYASENHRLLTEILRDEWGFDGVVVSDWGAVNDRVKGLKAGLELEMPGTAIPSNDDYIVAAVKSGELDEAILDEAVERLLRLIVRVGREDQCCGKHRCGEIRKEVLAAERKASFDKDKHHALGRKIASESMVLLKNKDNILPLDKEAKVAFIGEFAEKPRYQGSGSSQVNPTMMTTALDASKEYPNITYCKGYDIEKCDDVNEVLQAGAIEVAKTSDVCVLFIGLPTSYESEGYDRTHMRLPEGQNKLVKAITDVNSNVVVVLLNGSPVEMPWVNEVSAILEAYLGGQAGGGAVVDILYGIANPCGKLAETMPIKLSDNPSYLYYFGERDMAEYREGIFVGYRYYDTKDMKVLFPFGHGLSYTTFEYSNLQIDKTSMNDTDKLMVTADITNTGKVAGKEIVQLYVGLKNDNTAPEREDRIVLAEKELRDFVKIPLEPGETTRVVFVLDKSAFAYYSTEINDWHVLDGTYEIKLGRSSRDIAVTAEVKVTPTVEIPFKATANTTVRDIRRMKNGAAFLEEIAKTAPAFEGLTANPEPGTFEYMHMRAIPEIVFRQLRLMGAMQGKSLEDLQKMIDEKLN